MGSREMGDRVIDTVFEDVVGAVDKLAADGVPAADVLVTQRLVGMRGEIDRLEAVFVAHVGALDGRGGFVADGAVSAASWLRAQCAMTGGAASGRVQVARRLDAMPKVARAFAAGEISFAHVHVLARALIPEVEDDFRAVEEEFLTVARHATPAGLRRVVEQYLVDRADDGGEKRDQRQRDLRRLHVSRTFEGMVAIDGLLDPEAGEVVITALEGIMRVDRDREGDADHARSSSQRRADALVDICAHLLDEGAVAGTGRECPHVSAIIDLVAVNSDLAAAAYPAGSGAERCACGAARAEHGGESETDRRDEDSWAAEMTVLPFDDVSEVDNGPATQPTACDTETAATETAATETAATETAATEKHSGYGAAGGGNGTGVGSGGATRAEKRAGPAVADPSPKECGDLEDGLRAELEGVLGSALLTPRLWGPGRWCELERGGPISVETARRLMCDCSLVRIVTAGSSEPLDVGRQTRVISPAMRRALVFRDRHCQYPGCDRPASWCDGHHSTHWLDDGPTSTRNLVLLCRRHHRRVHEGGQRIRRERDGVVHVYLPDGTEVARPRDRGP